MKNLLFLACVTSLLVICIYYDQKKQELHPGDITFTFFDADNDAFGIVAHVDIPSNTIVHFTDSEWNGNRFGFDENNLSWNTGGNKITAGTHINFTKLDTLPSVNIGFLKNKMKISKKEDAIFAYSGHTRMPSVFLAAAANSVNAYGTLINTGLQQGTSALLFSGEPTAEAR
ncbi:hypothetical protein [Flagellimonas onchidii]|uniref:hypothetical protein n=1 Tax=Flagellimonas onchidii TaxID=2562684 RepID=UPI0010A5CCB8|nr:hypothetical protein [Allomuricauda onchidii]